MNAIDRKRLVQRLERDADAEAWADEFLYKHPKFIAGIVYYANRMLEEIESGAFDIKPLESNGRTKPMNDTEKKIEEIREALEKDGRMK